MSFVKDLVVEPIKAVGGFFKDVTGRTAAAGASRAADEQTRAIQEALGITEAGVERGLGFLEPFGAVGEQGLGQAGFLTDPQAQFEFLQSNPLFQLALENANVQTKNLAASRGRLSAGDTLQQLSQNVLLSASPLIQQQKASIGDVLGLGAGVAGSQANLAVGGAQSIADLITSGGDVRAAGEAGAATARGEGAKTLLNLGTTLFGGI